MRNVINLVFRMLSNGYFPRELPPPFTANSFANLIYANYSSLPKDFRTLRESYAAEHNIVRVGTLRRKLGIPNPFSQFALSEEIIKNWSTIKDITNSSQIAISKPRFSAKNSLKRCIIPQSGFDKIPLLRSEKWLGSKYLLKTDIANFYHSIYTHTIPWALDGKERSKKNKNCGDSLGNMLDCLIRSGQGKQTVGIPIGPDTSFIIAETLLSSIDKLIIDELGKVNGFRFSDDYELAFQNVSAAEKALSKIESILSDFELELNSRKTLIKKLPSSLEESWVRDLKLFEFRDNAEKNDIISYFSHSFDYANENPESYVLKYALSRLKNIKIKQDSWPLLQRLILECISSEPGTLPRVLDILSSFANKGYPIEQVELRGILNSQIDDHAPLGHESEVAWSIWGSILFRIPLDENSSKLISKMDDSVVALLALDANERGLFESTLDISKWSDYMDEKCLYGPNWLLSYEANIKKWISPDEKDHVNGDSRFGYLKRNRVQFYDPNKCDMSSCIYSSPIYENLSQI